MGIDVYLYAEGVATDEQIAAANAYLTARFGEYDPTWGQGWITRDEYFPGRLEFNTYGQRYYGPGYERGPWPVIYGYIRAMRAALPDCKVHYAGDSDDHGVEATTEALEEIWQHYLGPQGNAYRDGRS